jgi:hypothetical protein
MRIFSLCLMVVAGFAHASVTYPEAIKTKVGLSSAPACTVCHISPGDSPTKPFYKSLQKYGLTSGGNTVALESALTSLTTNQDDSDADGVSDINELKTGGNPNVKDQTAATDGGVSSDGGTPTGGGDPVVPSVKYGCGSTAVPELLALCGVLLFRRRSR